MIIRLQDIFARRLEDVLKTSSRRLQDALKTFWRRLEDVSQDVLKMSWRYLKDVFKTSCRRLENVLKRLGKTSWRRLEDEWQRRIYWSWPSCLEDVLWSHMTKSNIFVLMKTCWRRLLKMKAKDIFKTSSSRRMFSKNLSYS